MAAKRITIGVRFPREIVDAIDGYGDQLRARLPPGVEVNRSDATRALVERALAALKSEAH